MHLTYIPYIDEFYLLSNFKRCYDDQFHPIQHPNYWLELSFTEVHSNAGLIKEPSWSRTSKIHNEMNGKESNHMTHVSPLNHSGYVKQCLATVRYAANVTQF